MHYQHDQIRILPTWVYPFFPVASKNCLAYHTGSKLHILPNKSNLIKISPWCNFLSHINAKARFLQNEFSCNIEIMCQCV